MKELPIGRQVFSELIEQNLLYVDKTRWLWELVREGKFYFFSRPRRFGKTLLLSTLKSFFEGREDLFRGLYIYDQVKEWKTHPILYIDYARIEYQSGRDAFNLSLLNYLNEIALQYELKINKSIPKDFLNRLVLELSRKYGQVVILVDEYDKPLVDTLNDEKAFNENQEILRGLYGNIKGLDAHLRFVFLTGVSRFAKVGVFSGMNNLLDISLNKQLNALVGFTQEELELHFSPYLKQLCQTLEITHTDLIENIRNWYNGFSWDGITRLYNPFSILNLFRAGVFDNYWFSTGTPTFLINLLKTKKQLPADLEHVIAVDLTGGAMQVNKLSLIPLLFQTGYLTIQKITREGVKQIFHLSYPNDEVRNSFLTYLLAAFIEKDEVGIDPEAIQLKQALNNENIDQFLRHLKSFFADIPARLHISQEAYYHSLMYMLLRLVGLKMNLEKETDKGRIDAVLELEDKVYIIEVKFATNKRIKNVKTLSKNALKQIDDKRYYEAWLGGYKKIILLGIGFLDKAVHGQVKIV